VFWLCNVLHMSVSQSFQKSTQEPLVRVKERAEYLVGACLGVGSGGIGNLPLYSKGRHYLCPFFQCTRNLLQEQSCGRAWQQEQEEDCENVLFLLQSC